jgi:hypothetical protein
LIVTKVAKQQAALEQYERDGYAVFHGVLDAELVGEAGEHVAWLLERHPDVQAEQLGHTLMRDDPFWFRLVSDERLVDLAAVFVGPDVALYASHYISKPPLSGQPVLWHQDGAYWPLKPMRVVTLWLAVDESNPENGCLRVIPGSHRQDLAGLRANTEVDNVLGSESDVEVDESQAVDLILSPGDVEVHHPNIMHGSAANTSPNRRCGLTIRYIPTSTRILGAEQPFASAFHLRGDPGVNRYQPTPRYVAGRHFPFAGAEAFA